MDVKVAAQRCLNLLLSSDLTWEAEDPSTSSVHLRAMLRMIMSGVVTDNKAHMWLGWVQGVMVSMGVSDLETMKEKNRPA